LYEIQIFVKLIVNSYSLIHYLQKLVKMKIDKLKKYILNKLENELSKKLTYHGVHHTIDVLNTCKFYVNKMKLPANDAFLLYTAALFHDTGFLKAYENHEENSILFARNLLPEWNYTSQEIEIIAGIIKATKIPQKPTNRLEEIMGDADLDYLGTDLFYPIGETLYKELVAFNKISTRRQWDEIQIKFLQNHSYHTPFAAHKREPVKQKHLIELITKLNKNNFEE